MGKVILIRHGQTEYNVEGKLSGQKDTPLTEKGINQAKKISQYFESVSYDNIFSSDLLRALETANIISDQVVVTPLLREINFGEFEGKTRREIFEKHPELEEGFEYVDGYPGGETYSELQQRLTEFVTKHINSQETTLVVAHSVTNKMLKKVLLDEPYDNLFFQNNDEVVVIDIDDKTYKKIGIK